jgi:hypothetical protein
MNIVNRLRSPLIALVVLALSATAVFAAKTISDTSNVGLAQANAASSHVPQAGVAEAPDKSPEGKDSTTGTDATTGTKPSDNHGAAVSGAASLSFVALKAACGGTLTNKGAYISLIARGLYVFSSSTGTITCRPAPTTSTSSPSSSAGATSPKPHGKANADVKRTAHQPQSPR